jgi:hypothetical protein
MRATQGMAAAGARTEPALMGIVRPFGSPARHLIARPGPRPCARIWIGLEEEKAGQRARSLDRASARRLHRRHAGAPEIHRGAGSS